MVWVVEKCVGMEVRHACRKDTEDQLNMYAYVGNDPWNHTDPSGQEVEVSDPKQKRYFERLINSRALGVFKFNKDNKLERTSSKGNAKTHSSYYANRLQKAISSSQTITLTKTKTFTPPDGKGRAMDVQKDQGGGLTWGGGGNGEKVAISGHVGKGFKDVAGNPLRYTPADILGHELLGHAIPHIIGSDTGNAIQNENKARAQEVGAGQRFPEPDHLE